VGDRDACHFDRCVGASLGSGAGFDGGGSGQGAERFSDEGEAFGVEGAVEAAHPVEQCRQVDCSGVVPFLGGAFFAVRVGVHPPRVEDQCEVVVGQGGGPAAQHLFVAGERVGGVGAPGVGEQAEFGFGDLAGSERGLDERHVLDAVGQLEGEFAVADALAGRDGEPVGG
jgi:hypothetical protein